MARSGHIALLVASLPLLLSACGNRLAPSLSAPPLAPTTRSGAVADAAVTSKAKFPEADGLFPTDSSGWQEVGKKEQQEIDRFAKDYFAFLAATATQAEAARFLVELAKEAGALPFDSTRAHKANTLLYWQDRAGSSVAFLKIGKRPIAEGLQVILASTDNPVIRLTASPAYQKSGLTLFDTTILGELELSSWLNTPLMLNLRKGAGENIRIGDSADEPVFTIPDLLPHLSRKVQKKGLVDSPERLDALAAFSRTALAKGLSSYGIAEGDWSRLEAELLPAEGASFIGVDRALISSANHAARAFPFAATQALMESESDRTSLVILMGHSKRSVSGANAEDHIVNLLPRAIGQVDSKLDALDLRRIYSRTSVLLFDNYSGERNAGVVLNSRKDDAYPEAFRMVLQRFAEAKLQYQIVESPGWSEAREVASLDMNAVEVGLPMQGVGTPNALLSTLDLYQALLASKAWFTP